MYQDLREVGSNVPDNRRKSRAYVLQRVVNLGGEMKKLALQFCLAAIVAVTVQFVSVPTGNGGQKKVTTPTRAAHPTLQSIKNRHTSSKKSGNVLASIRGKRTSSFRRVYFPHSVGAITVNSIVDEPAVDPTLADTASNGFVTLRSAIQFTNAAAGQDTIIVPPGLYNLTWAGPDEDTAAAGDLDINDSLVILGAGESQTVINGNTSDRDFDIGPANSNISVKITSLTVDGGYPTGESGGGIQMYGGTVELDSVDVVQNTADQNGGGIEVISGTLTMNYGMLSSNFADFSGSSYQGGGADFQAGTASFFNVHIDSNIAANGGGIQNGGSGANISCSYCTFIGDSTIAGFGSGGGGFDNDDGNFTMDHCILKHNYGDLYSGAIDIDGGDCSIMNCIIDSNYTAAYVGGVYTGGNSVTMMNDSVRWNSAAFDGGGIAASDSLRIYNSDVSFNSVGNRGAGIFFYGIPVYDTLSNVRICGNSAALSGGGVYLSGPVYFTNVEVDSNTSLSTGGGVEDDIGFLIWSGGTLRKNTSSGPSSAFYFNGSFADSIVNVDASGNGSNFFTNSSSPVYVSRNGSVAATLALSSETSQTAGVNGQVNANGATTTVRFLYGTSPDSLKDSVLASPGSVGGNSDTPVSAVLSGLSAATTYYTAVATTSSNGYIVGAIEQFNTLPPYSGSPGNALKFDGSSDYVSAPVPTTATSGFTMEGWVKWNGGTPSNQVLFYSGNTSSTGYGIFLDQGASNAASLLAGGNFIQDSYFTLPVGVWTHVALTRDGSGLWTLYLNGVSQALGSGGPNVPAGNLFIGGHSGFSTETFNGTIDEVRFWSVSKDSNQIREDMHLAVPPTTSNLITEYQFNDSTGTTAFDVVSGQNGTLSNFSFNTSDGWVTSTAPEGSGTSGDSTGFESGTANLGHVSLATTDAFDTTIEITATEIDEVPDSLPPNPGALLTNRYWVITPFGIPGTYSTDITFTVPSYFTANGSEATSSYTLFHRGDEDDGSWTTAVSGAASVTATTITFNGLTSFSQFMIGSSDVSLAVSVTDFIASTDIGSVTLSWKTRSEVGNAGFNLMRQKLGASSWQLVGSYTSNKSLVGLGTSSTGKDYQFTDAHVSSGATYIYKLQSVSTSGTTKDMNTLQVTVGVPKAYALYQNYPNPFNPSTTIRFDLKQTSTVTITVYNVLGQKVMEQDYGTMDAGRYNETFSMNRFASGVYYYRISAVGVNGEKFESIKKLVLMK